MKRKATNETERSWDCIQKAPGEDPASVGVSTSNTPRTLSCKHAQESRMKDLEQQLPSDAKPEKPQCAPHRESGRRREDDDDGGSEQTSVMVLLVVK